MNNKGGILTALIPLSLAMFAFLIFILNTARGYYWKEKIQTVTDNALLASLLMRADGLENIAARWNIIKDKLRSGDSVGAHIHSADWGFLQRESQKIYRSVPGYKGRITAINKVIFDAHEINRDNLLILNDRGSQLGIQSHGMNTTDENGLRRVLKEGWYSRQWDMSQRLGQPQEITHFLTTLNLPLIGLHSSWTIKTAAKGKLFWNADPTNPRVQALGLGGYPREWNDVLFASHVWPHRFPFYSAALLNE